jgi:tetratricopeptide (TPR) repeat protein
MAHAEKRQEEKSFKEKLSQFLHTYKYVILGIGGALIVVLIATGIYTMVHQNRVEASSKQAEELISLMDEWRSAEEQSEKDDLQQDIRELSTDIRDSYSGLFAAQRALLILGQLEYALENKEEAARHFMELADRYQSSYLAPVALMSAGVCKEELQRYDEAISHYQRVRDQYADTAPEAPHALFSIGRLYEMQDERESALDAYNELIDNFSASNWTKLARDRIIYLNSQG